MPLVDVCLIRPHFPSPPAASLPQLGCFCTSDEFALLFRVSIEAGEFQLVVIADPTPWIPPSMHTSKVSAFSGRDADAGSGCECIYVSSMLTSTADRTVQ